MTAPCPTCATPGFANPGELAAHLIDVHRMAGIAALTLARSTFPTEETSMPQKRDRTGECPECHGLRHKQGCSRYVGKRHRKTQAMSAPEKVTGTCGYCKHERPDHSKTCRRVDPSAAKKRTLITRRHPLPSRKVGGPKGAQPTTGLVSEIAALGAVAEALTALDLDQRRNVLGCICKLLAIDPSKLAA